MENRFEFDDSYKHSMSLDDVNLEVLREAQKILDMEKLIATRYCLDKEIEKSHSNLWEGIRKQHDKLLKLHKSPSFEFKNDDCNFPIEGEFFHQREEDLKPNEFIITISQDMMNGKNLSEEDIEDLMNKFYYHPLQIQRFPTLEEAVEKLCEELKSDADYYRSWKDNIAMSFKDEYWRTYNKEGFSENELTEIHTIANKAADNFLKQLIK